MLKRVYLPLGFMMLRTKATFVCLMVTAVYVYSNIASAKSNAECLKHLGGGYGDAECYSGLSVDLVSENKKLYQNLRATMPAGNIHAKLLAGYMATQDESLKYCELQRNAGAKWATEHDGSMFPALYGQCIYDLRKAQNKFLKNLLEMANW